MVSRNLSPEQDGTPKQICFANHAGDFSPTAANDLRITTDGSNETDVELVLLNLAGTNPATAGAQSTQGDLGALRAPAYKVRACLEWQVAAATDAGTVSFYWAPSSSATAATGNPGGVSGTAGAYSGYSSDLATARQQLVFIGIMIQTDDAVDSVQIGEVGILEPTERYGTLVVINEATQTLCDTDDIEAHVVFDPILDESQ